MQIYIRLNPQIKVWIIKNLICAYKEDTSVSLELSLQESVPVNHLVALSLIFI